MNIPPRPIAADFQRFYGRNPQTGPLVEVPEPVVRDRRIEAAGTHLLRGYQDNADFGNRRQRPITGR